MKYTVSVIRSTLKHLTASLHVRSRRLSVKVMCHVLFSSIWQPRAASTLFYFLFRNSERRSRHFIWFLAIFGFFSAMHRALWKVRAVNSSKKQEALTVERELARYTSLPPDASCGSCESRTAT